MPPHDRVIHLWVDPVYGNDSATAGTPGAAFLNPNGTAACSVVPFLPNDFLDPGQGNVPLLHAAWPFRTVTGAINYLYNNSPNTPPAPPLPYASASGFVAKAAIIHLLPGRYAAGTTVEPHSRLVANGETFPIHLPPFVSVRGTSALNTVFDLTTNMVGGVAVGPAFEFGVLATPNSPRWEGLEIPITGEGSWIDRVSFVGVRSVDLSSIPYERSAAVVLRHLLQASLTISNCFFFKNRVGLAVAAPMGDPAPFAHEATVINCTFVDHRIGLWNGQADPSNPNAQGTGVSQLALINNIFDSMPMECDGIRPPSWPASWGISSSDFEGVSGGDLSVIAPNPWPGNYNAYNRRSDGTRHYDYGGQILANYNPTRARPNDPPGAPGVNIAPYTGWQMGLPHVRGVLYIRDLLCNGPVGDPTQFPSSGNWDRSPMDLRLSPSVALSSSGTPAPPSTLNPLVDAGYGDAMVDATLPLANPITMGSGLTLTRPPGYIVLGSTTTDQVTWLYSSWDQDCEGYGNRRFHDHPAYGNASPTSQKADIGADEVDDYITAGYRAMTTSYMAAPEQAPLLAMDNRYLTYVGPAGAGGFLGFPSFRGYQYTPPANYNTAYGTTNPPWAATWSFGGSGTYYAPTRVDVVPHLLPDLHPWWMFTIISAPTNPIWQSCVGPYNFWLFANPSVGVINPPGTAPIPGFVSSFEWLDEFDPMGSPVFRRFGPWGGGPSNLVTFSNWCVGNNGSPPSYWDTFPSTGTGVALRFSTEVDGVSLFGSLDRNVQTMHVFVQEL